jgi:hypothetical protein
VSRGRANQSTATPFRGLPGCSQRTRAVTPAACGHRGHCDADVLEAAAQHGPERRVVRPQIDNSMFAAERVGVTRTSAEGICSWRGRATPRSGGDPRGGHRSVDPSPRPAPSSPRRCNARAGAPPSPPSDQHRALAYIAQASVVKTSTTRCLRMHKNWVRAVRYGPGADLPPASVLRSRRPPSSRRRPALIGRERSLVRTVDDAPRGSHFPADADWASIDIRGEGERHAQAVIAGDCDLRYPGGSTTQDIGGTSQSYGQGTSRLARPSNGTPGPPNGPGIVPIDPNTQNKGHTDTPQPQPGYQCNGHDNPLK